MILIHDNRCPQMIQQMIMEVEREVLLHATQYPEHYTQNIIVSLHATLTTIVLMYFRIYKLKLVHMKYNLQQSHDPLLLACIFNFKYEDDLHIKKQLISSNSQQPGINLTAVDVNIFKNYYLVFWYLSKHLFSSFFLKNSLTQKQNCSFIM